MTAHISNTYAFSEYEKTFPDVSDRGAKWKHLMILGQSAAPVYTWISHCLDRYATSADDSHDSFNAYMDT